MRAAGTGRVTPPSIGPRRSECTHRRPQAQWQCFEGRGGFSADWHGGLAGGGGIQEPGGWGAGLPMPRCAAKCLPFATVQGIF